MTSSVLPLQTIAPSAEDRAVALKSSQILPSCLNSEDSHYRIEVVSGETASQAVTIPASALRLLADVLTQIASGHAVKIVPIKQELSTSEAADLINVSRSYFVGLLESGKIPFCTVGTRGSSSRIEDGVRISEWQVLLLFMMLLSFIPHRSGIF